MSSISFILPEFGAFHFSSDLTVHTISRHSNIVSFSCSGSLLSSSKMAPALVVSSVTQSGDGGLKKKPEVTVSKVQGATTQASLVPSNIMADEATFARVPLGLVDTDEVLLRKMRADTSPKKIDLVAGVYRNEKGTYHEFNVIKQAKEILAQQDLGHDGSCIFPKST